MEKDIFATYLSNLKKMETPQRINEIKEVCKTNEEFFDLAVINGLVVLPDEGVHSLNVYIKDGKVSTLEKSGNILPSKKVVDAGGKYVCPGIIDPHVHLGLFSSLEGEIQTETKSALFGGITTIGCHVGGAESHFDTYPELYKKIEMFSYTDVIPHFVIGNQQQLKEVPEYIEHLGITSFKIYMNGIEGMIPDVDDEFTLDMFQKIQESQKNCIVCVHAENKHIVKRANRIVRELYGEKARMEHWDATHPDIAEEEAVVRLSYLAKTSGVPVYFVHITSKLAAKKLREIKKDNTYIKVETTSPYLSINKENITGNEFKMEPPIREIRDQEELWSALKDGVIDTIGTDNVTLTREEKNCRGNMWNTLPGYPALETHLPSVLSEGVIKRGIPIERVITAMTKNVARTFGVYPQKGTLLPGSDGDIVIIDMNIEKEVNPMDLHSRSDFSIFAGRTLRGWPITTIKGGVVMVEEGALITDLTTGVVLER